MTFSQVLTFPEFFMTIFMAKNAVYVLAFPSSSSSFFFFFFLQYLFFFTIFFFYNILLVCLWRGIEDSVKSL